MPQNDEVIPERSQTDVEVQLRKYHEAKDYEKAATLAIQVYGPGLYGFALTLVRDPDAADVVFSQTCFNIWKAIGSFRWASSFYTWAYKITRNACFQYTRDEKKWDVTEIEKLPVLSRLVDRVRTQTAPYLKTEVKDKILDLRRKLKPEEQALLTLRIDKHMSWKEVVEVFQKEEDNIEINVEEMSRRIASYRKKFERLKDKLRKFLKEEGLLGS